MGLQKSHSVACSWFLCLTCLLLTSIRCQEQLVERTRTVHVGRGSVYYFQPDDFVFSAALGNMPCMIKVDYDPAGRLSVGDVEPKVFPCNIQRNHVRYVHNGNPFVRIDLIRMVVHYFRGNNAISQTVQVSVFIDSADHLIFADILSLKPLVLDVASGLTSDIDTSILRFQYAFFDEAICTVTTYEPGHRLQSLLFGSLVTRYGVSLSNMTFDCREFLHSGLRYKHDGISKFADDYVMLRAEVTEQNCRRNSSETRILENIFLPVYVANAAKNSPPKLSRTSEGHLRVDQFTLLILSSDAVWFSDDETPDKNLVINVTKPTAEEDGEGYLVHIYDQWKPIRTFRQEDLSSRRIAYRPPSTPLTTQKVFEVQLSAVDGQFLNSEHVTLTVNVIPARSTSPKVVRNNVLTVMSGGFRILTTRNILIVDSDNINDVEMHVRGGLYHGNLTVRGRTVSTFRVTDLERNYVVYTHGGGNSVEDKIMLRISDRRSSIRMQLTISILAKEESLPVLLTKRVLEVLTDKYVAVAPYHLNAYHPRAASDDILFEIKSFPQHGRIVKLSHPLSSGCPVSVFSQQDVAKGRIWFQRISPEHVDGVDSVRFALLLRGTTSNNSALHSFEIKIRPFHGNLPPVISVGATLHVRLNETDVVRITKDMLSYEDPEKPNDSVFYTVTCSPFFVGSSLTTDAGRLTAVDNVSTSPAKNSNAPLVSSFTQAMVDRGILIYVAPELDIGSDPVEVQFIFSVSDQLNNTLRSQRLNITLLPVNDQMPQMVVRPLRVREGGYVSLNGKSVAVSDVDTPLGDLILTLEQTPKYGQLVNEDHEMVAGDRFGVEELDRSLLRYLPGSSQNSSDRFELSVSDGVHKVTRSIPITIILQSRSLQLSTSNSSILFQVEEGREVILGNLTSVEVGEAASFIYEILRSPEHGEIRVDGVKSEHFHSSELASGAVRYCHQGGEIGQEPVKDSLLLIVSREGQDSDYSLVEISMLISPVDNAPPQLMVGIPLMVSEGKMARLTSEVISAWDLDTGDSDLLFVVSQMPVWGSLVKSRSSRSERSDSKRTVSSFTMSDLKEGVIQYIQSNHPEGGAPSDSFFIYATDGRQNSNPGKVEVTVMKHVKDEQSTFGNFEVDDITVEEGGEKAFDIKLSQAVRSRSELMLSLAESPSHGQVILVMSAHQNNGVKEVMLREVAVSDLLFGVQLVYQHDGSETSSDQFVLSLSLGSKVIQRVARVRVLPVNDARPEIIRNDILRVRFGESAVIDEGLLKAVDADNPANQVQYVLVSPPRKGILELARVNSVSSVWLEMKPGESFSQWDVNSGFLRYSHTKNLGDIPKDNFVFQLTDGKNLVSHETFEISIVKPGTESVIVHNHGLVVNSGTSKVITSDLLRVVGSRLTSDYIRYFISRPPAIGSVELCRNETGTCSPVTIFNQSDLDRRAIFYSHNRNLTAKNDSFAFSVRGSRNETMSSGFFHIQILQRSSQIPALERNVPLMVVHGSLAAMTSANLRISSPGIPAQNLIYTIVEPPHHGKILLNDTSIGVFTQKDLDDNRVFYGSNSTDESMMDYFLFTISHRPISGQTPFNLTADTKPQFFSILIQPISKIAPSVELVRPLGNLVSLGADQFGFIVTNRHLSSTHPLFGANDVVYYIREKPEAGYFENRGTKKVIKKRFSQKDVNDERIVYVINEDVQATNDSVLLRLTDPNRNVVDGIRLEMHWSVIEWSQPQYIVCEDIQLLPLTVHRRGLANQSATVQVRAKPMSAKERLDYIPRSNTTIVFPPGVTKVNWMIEIIDDGLREGKEEKFRVALRNATNAILGSNEKAIVQLIDFEDGHCTEYIGMISKNKKESSFNMDEIPPQSPSKNISNLRPLSSSSSSSAFGTVDRSEESTLDEYDYDEYFDRMGDAHSKLLKSDLSFYNGGTQEQTTQSPSEPIARRRAMPSTQKPGGTGRERTNLKTKSRLNITQPCKQDTKGLLFFDLQSSKMFRCTGDHWQPWNWETSGKASSMLKDSSAPAVDGEMLRMENFVPSRGDGQRTICPAGWTSYNNSCFTASSGRLSWIDAEAACQRDGAHLTHVQSRDHLVWLWSLGDESQFWTGLHKRTEWSSWQYTDSTLVQYYNWRNHYPCIRCRFSHCVVVGHRMEFMNKACDKLKMKYICVRSPRHTRRSLPRQ